MILSRVPRQQVIMATDEALLKDLDKPDVNHTIFEGGRILQDVLGCLQVCLPVVQRLPAV